MKRAGGVALVILAAALIGAGPAAALCSDEIQLLRQKLTTVKEPPRRAELEKLIEKAEKDDKARRTQLCEATVKDAQALLQ